MSQNYEFPEARGWQQKNPIKPTQTATNTKTHQRRKKPLTKQKPANKTKQNQMQTNKQTKIQLPNPLKIKKI